MTPKRYDYIIIYCCLFAAILILAILARIFVISELKMDEFSGLVAFIVTCLLLGAAYLSFQSIINEWLLPVVERIFGTKQQIDTPQEPAEIEQIEEPEPFVPGYDLSKQSAQQKIAEQRQETLERVLAYTTEELSLYIKEAELIKLHDHIRMFQYANEYDCTLIRTSVTIDSKLKSIDLMHFGWNIGNQLGKSNIETATFIKHVFVKELKDNEISTIKRKLRSTDSSSIIQIKEEL